MQLSRPFTKTADVTSRNLDSNLPVFSQVLAQPLLNNIRLFLCSLYPLRSNENLKTIVELTLTLNTQAIVERNPLLQALSVPGSPWLLTQLIK
jgi:hypothetical protein